MPWCDGWWLPSFRSLCAAASGRNERDLAYESPTIRHGAATPPGLPGRNGLRGGGLHPRAVGRSPRASASPPGLDFPAGHSPSDPGLSRGSRSGLGLRAHARGNPAPGACTDPVSRSVALRALYATGRTGAAHRGAAEAQADRRVLPWLSDQAVALLRARGFRVRKILDGVSEWQAAGLPVQGISPLQHGGRP
jgi:hypothetical protein